MKRWALLAILLASTSISAAQQNSQPFDMTPERTETGNGDDATQPVTTDAAPDVSGGTVARPVTSEPARRQLLPDGNKMLAGEVSSLNWTVHLTAAQAASTASLNLGYRNAVVVAPESSRFQFLINNVEILDEAVRSAEGPAALKAPVPAGLLRPGRNELSLRARQHHRTDCTIQSTYELWTEVDAAKTFLSFDDQRANAFTGVGDLRALAPDAEGRTHVQIVVPSLDRLDVSAEILRLAQAIALYANQPSFVFSVTNNIEPDEVTPSLRVLLGTQEELQQIYPNAVANAPSGPSAGFIADSNLPTFVVSGSNREDWNTAIGEILASVDREAGSRREALITETWRSPNAPMIYGERSLTFGELGIPSEQFSGRRYLRSFTFAIPADFYAGSYGEARLLLDAAYSEAVLPGSTINVYVNGEIAASMQFTERTGAILRQLPVKVTMRHFRPGLNEIAVEAEILTEQDAACLPGAPADTRPRFAVFDTSRFVVPDFARIGQIPNLGATAGTGSPYGQSSDEVAIIRDQSDPSNLSVAATLLARIAVSAGRSVPVSSTSTPDATRDKNAIFIGPINSIPAAVLSQVGISEDAVASWSPLSGPAAPIEARDEVSVEAWRNQVSGPGLGTIGDWLYRTFGITLDMMRFVPSDDALYSPSQSEAILVAQGTNPANTGVWTVVSAPTGAGLADGAATLADHRVWARLDGKIATLGNDLRTISTKPVATFSLIESQPLSFSNYRLIAANWLSANILSYSVLLVVGCVLLGVGTSGLLSRLGRRR